MKNLSKLFLYFLIVVSVMFFSACSKADTDQDNNVNHLIVKAKKVTKKFNLSTVPMSCLIFKKLDEKFEGKVIVDVSEKHGGKCGGDPETSPRIFSIGFDESKNEIWSDAKSLVGQMEKLN